MGVNVRITLPFSAQSRHITEVAGILAGCKREETRSYPHVTGVTLTTGQDFSPQMLKIELQAQDGGRLIDGQESHFTYLFMETSDARGKLLIPPSTAFWIAVGRGLVDFFGGELDYSDCDDSQVDYRIPERDNRTDGGSGGGRYGDGDARFYALQHRLSLVEPLTERDLENDEQYATYKREMVG